MPTFCGAGIPPGFGRARLYRCGPSPRPDWRWPPARTTDVHWSSPIWRRPRGRWGRRWEGVRRSRGLVSVAPDQAAYSRLRAPTSEEAPSTDCRRARVSVDAPSHPQRGGQRSVMLRDTDAVPAAGRHGRPPAHRLHRNPWPVRTGRGSSGLWRRGVRPGRLPESARTRRRPSPARRGVERGVAAGGATGGGDRRLVPAGGGSRRSDRGHGHCEPAARSVRGRR